MVNPTKNNVIKAIKEVRKLFNELRNNFHEKKQRKLEKNFIKRKLFIIF